MRSEGGFPVQREESSPPRGSRGSSTPIRVCYVTEVVDSVRPIVRLKDLRDRHGFEVAAVIPSAEGRLGAALRSAAIPFHVRRLDLGREYPAVLAAIVELADLFRQERYDVVQGQDFNATLLSRLAAWTADVPVRVTSTVGLVHLEAPLPRWIDRATSWMDTLFLGVDYTLAHYRAQGVAEQALCWMGSAPDAAVFDPSLPDPPRTLRRRLDIPDHARLVGLVGHFYPRLPGSPWLPPLLHGRCAKGHEDFLRAAALVVRKAPHSYFILVGGGFGEAGSTHLEEMRALARTLNLERHVSFVGAQSDMSAVLREIDVCAQPSRSENLSSATLEALLMARPLVSTRTGGQVDIVEHGVTGLLVPPDDPLALAEALVWMIENPKKAAHLGQAGRQRVLNRVNAARLVDKLAERYSEQVRNRVPGYRQRVAWRRGLWLRPVLSALFAKIVWETLAFSHPPTTWRNRLSHSMLAAGFAHWGPRVLGMKRYRYLATSVFGFLNRDGSFKPSRLAGSVG